MSARSWPYETPDTTPALLAWQSLWSSFWQSVCSRCGLQDLGELTTYFFYGESLLHLIQWRRVVDRACLDEACQGWGLWLSGRLAAEGPWRGFARQEANRSMPELTLRNETTQRIATAAAETVEEIGMAGLTPSRRGPARRPYPGHCFLQLPHQRGADTARPSSRSIRKSSLPRGWSIRPPGLRRETAFDALSGYDPVFRRA